MASYRYRVEMPVNQLKNKKDITPFINEGEADVVIFSKPRLQDVELAIQCKKDGTKIVVDLCDDHFDHKEIGPIYRVMASMADRISCPTRTMANKVFEVSGKDAFIVPDMVEQQKRTPHADGENILWFGHQRNLPSLIGWMDRLENLRVCTGENSLLSGYVPWSEKNLIHELQVANNVFLPAIDGGDYKSPNRLVNAMMAGCFCVCGSQESYKEFKQFAWVGKVETGLKWAKVNKKDLNDLVDAGQKHIEKNYSADFIGNQWECLINGL